MCQPNVWQLNISWQVYVPQPIWLENLPWERLPAVGKTMAHHIYQERCVINSISFKVTVALFRSITVWPLRTVICVELGTVPWLPWQPRMNISSRVWKAHAWFLPGPPFLFCHEFPAGLHGWVSFSSASLGSQIIEISIVYWHSMLGWPGARGIEISLFYFVPGIIYNFCYVSR